MRLAQLSPVPLLAPALALAQGTVTVYGITDVSVLRGTGSVANRVQLASGGMDLSRLGLSGAEDLGNGYKATFGLEADVVVDSGRGVPSNADNQPIPNSAPLLGAQGLLFDRLAVVGMQAPWGGFRVGRDYTPSFVVQALYDPGGAGGQLGTQSTYGSIVFNSQPAAVRASNSIAIAIGELRDGPLLHLSYALGENPSNSGATRHDGEYRGARLAYTKPAVDVALGYGVYKVSSLGDIRQLVLGGKFTVRDTTLWLEHLREWTGNSDRMHGSMIGLSHTIGPWWLRTSLSHSARSSFAGAPVGTTLKAVAGVAYNFSKRTAVYGNLARTRNSHGATQLPNTAIAQTAPNHGGTGQELGVRHSF